MHCFFNVLNHLKQQKKGSKNFANCKKIEILFLYYYKEIRMANGFLITSLSGALKRINDILSEHVLKTLHVQVYLKKLQTNLGSTYWVSNKLIDVYSSAFHMYPELDLRIIVSDLKKGGIQGKITKKINNDIDVISLPKSYICEEITSFINSKKNLSVILFEELEESEDDKKNCAVLKMYDNVVLGGTFDRLHAGHKILLSQASLQCSKILTVGVTDDNMTKGKILWELIEPCNKRIENVKSFLQEIDNTIQYNVISIPDLYGPTKTDPSFNMIVLSTETVNGGHKINQARKENGLNELDMCLIELVEEASINDEEEVKISSSNLRKRLLGTRIKDPQKKHGLPDKPYIIGLTGGICSGKSSIGEFLQTLGAELIDCDKVAHQLYAKGTKLHEEIVIAFGKEILSENGEIDRKKLGSIVFSDPKKLQQLNEMLWPKIIHESMEQCKKLYEEKKTEIIILEAAVLLRAGWHNNVHEVWTTIIPPEEAVYRLMKRNNLTEEEANLRLQSQPSNSEQIAVANVVFCSLWSYEYTRKQVLKAWNMVNGL